MSEHHVYQAIAAVTANLAKTGIAKDRKNTQQAYNFRGIDDIYNALAPALSRAKLCMMPRVTRREVTERASRNGGVLFYVVCDMEFDFVSAEDGSRHTVAVVGEAMDSADKATNKAMSAAYKYAALMTFCIPTEGDNDADASTHEVAPPSDFNRWLDAIDSAPDESTLTDIAADLAKSSVNAADRTRLRAAFSARKHALAQVAA